MLLTGRRGIGAGHHDRLRIASEPLLQADCIVPGPARLSFCAPLHADTTTPGDMTRFAHGQ